MNLVVIPHTSSIIPARFLWTHRSRSRSRARDRCVAAIEADRAAIEIDRFCGVCLRALWCAMPHSRVQHVPFVTL